DRRVDEQTTAGAPPAASSADALSSDVSSLQSSRVELPLAVRGCRRTVRRKAPPFVQAQAGRFVVFPTPCFFPSLCHILLHRPAAEGHGCVMRRLGVAGPLSANSLRLLPHEGKYTILFQIVGTKQMKSSSK